MGSVIPASESQRLSVRGSAAPRKYSTDSPVHTLSFRTHTARARRHEGSALRPTPWVISRNVVSPMPPQAWPQAARVLGSHRTKDGRRTCHAQRSKATGNSVLNRSLSGTFLHLQSQGAQARAKSATKAATSESVEGLGCQRVAPRPPSAACEVPESVRTRTGTWRSSALMFRAAVDAAKVSRVSNTTTSKSLTRAITELVLAFGMASTRRPCFVRSAIARTVGGTLS